MNVPSSPPSTRWGKTEFIQFRLNSRKSASVVSSVIAAETNASSRGSLTVTEAPNAAGEGASVKTIRATSVRIRRLTRSGSAALPQITRCGPSRNRSPSRATAASLLGGAAVSADNDLINLVGTKACNLDRCVGRGRVVAVYPRVRLRWPGKGRAQSCGSAPIQTPLSPPLLAARAL